ncbi:hypothetical protein ACWD5R_45320, partial [Streptomyces sp. NPDC002514]
MATVSAKAERAGGLHEPQVQLRLRAGEHDAQSRAPGDQIVRPGLQTSGDREPADEPVGLVVEGGLAFGTEYGRLAAETGKAMRRIDPTIELVACGSSN